jgi:hypothetical protein
MWQGIRKAQEHIMYGLAAKHSCGKGSQVLNTGRQQNCFFNNAMCSNFS